MLHDRFLPVYDFVEKHQITINRSPEKIFVLIDELDFSESLIIRTLFRLRGMSTKMTLKKGLLQQNFIALEEHKNQELLLGLIGQFWKLNGNLKKVAPDKFSEFNEPGFSKATWNFKLVPTSGDVTILETETRIQTLDEKAHKFFSRYWFFIRPFSGLIRKEMLRSIKRKAERNASDILN